MDSVLAAFRASSLSNNLIGRNPSGYDAPTNCILESLDISSLAVTARPRKQPMTRFGGFLFLKGKS